MKGGAFVGVLWAVGALAELGKVLDRLGHDGVEEVEVDAALLL